MTVTIPNIPVVPLSYRMVATPPYSYLPLSSRLWVLSSDKIHWLKPTEVEYASASLQSNDSFFLSQNAHTPALITLFSVFYFARSLPFTR